MGPCQWEPEYPAGSAPAGDVARAVELAVDLLWAWTGRQFGVCSYTVTPCRPVSRPSTFGAGSGPRFGYGRVSNGWLPFLLGGSLWRPDCGTCAVNCRCDTKIRLPSPVDSITEVLLDGEVMDPVGWRLENHSRLARVDGREWPREGVTVTFKQGIQVPAAGRLAAGVLALEVQKALNGDDCQLPQRVQTVTRQGVTVAMLDAMEDIDEGHTGIWLVDAWVSSITQAPRPGRVYSPDTPRHTYGGL